MILLNLVAKLILELSNVKLTTSKIIAYAEDKRWKKLRSRVSTPNAVNIDRRNSLCSSRSFKSESFVCHSAPKTVCLLLYQGQLGFKSVLN